MLTAQSFGFASEIVPFYPDFEPPSPKYPTRPLRVSYTLRDRAEYEGVFVFLKDFLWGSVGTPVPGCPCYARLCGRFTINASGGCLSCSGKKDTKEPDWGRH